MAKPMADPTRGGDTHPDARNRTRGRRGPRANPRVESRWLQMRDGVRIAVDVVRPRPTDPERSLATILVMTRTWRSVRLRTPGSRGRLRVGPDLRLVDGLLADGFAVVAIDARGTGASDGVWPHPWSPDELEDCGEVVDWVVTQPWSNGRVGAAGIGYGATAAVLLGAVGRRDLRAISATGADYDFFAEAAMPGGLPNTACLREWSDRVGNLDRDRVPELLGRTGRLIATGVRPVDEDPRGRELRRIVAARHNPPLRGAFAAVEARDDPYGDQGIGVGALGIPSRMAPLRAASPPVQLWASWLDGATATAALRLFTDLPAVREVWITATSQAGDRGAGPFAEGRDPAPTLDERMATIAWFLGGPLVRNEAPPEQRRIHYVTMGIEGWQETAFWPPPGIVSHDLFLARDGLLQWEQGHDVGSVVVPLDPRATTGQTNRWHARLGLPVRYGDRAKADRLLATWTGAPLPEPLTISGDPVAILGIRASTEDLAIFAYLELVAPDGAVHYLTEGSLRAQHRGRRSAAPTYRRGDLRPLVPGERTELHIRLQPTSVLVPRRWRLRLAVAGADRGTFATGRGQPPELTIEFGGPSASRVSLPTLEEPT
jgi:putative CocE/NonD family hydrolase